jgi:hypothetical protein
MLQARKLPLRHQPSGAGKEESHAEGWKGTLGRRSGALLVLGLALLSGVDEIVEACTTTRA